MPSNVKYSTTTPVQAKSADELAALYGVKNKESDYAAALGAATEAKFGMWDTQTKGIRDQQLTDYASQFNQYQNYQRQGRQNALRSGLNRGSAVAQEVMSQVQNQAYGAQNQTGYQQQLADIAAQKGAQVGADKYNAMDMSNQTGLALGSLSAQILEKETAGQTGYQNYLASLQAGRDSITASAAYGSGNSQQAYDLALKSTGDPDAAFRIAYEGSTIDMEKKKQVDSNGLHKVVNEGAVETGYDGISYKYSRTGGWKPYKIPPVKPVPGSNSGNGGNTGVSFDPLG